MSVTVEKTGKTVEEAIHEALLELGASPEEAVIEVLDEGGTSLLGLKHRPAKVRVTLEEESDLEPEAEEEVPYYGDGEDYAGEAEVPEAPEEAEATAFIARVLKSIGIPARISSTFEEDTVFIDVDGRDCGAIIGRHGETLEALQYLTTLVANKQSEKHIRVTLDIAGYRRRREATLVDMAERAAERVVRSGKSHEMDPMSPAERRIIHTALQDHPDVTTFSEGVEPERRVVVAPKDT